MSAGWVLTGASTSTTPLTILTGSTTIAVQLIRMGKAYVCHLDADQIRDQRGTLTEPGRNSPYRERSVEENLELFAQMRSGELAEGSCVLRAKIDMASPNIIMRDPVLYRILKTSHHRTGDKWCIYPMYDFTHCLSDMIEGITHSLCTLEFKNNRPLYDWVLGHPGHPLPSPADRVCPAEYQLHGDEQAQAAATGERRTGPRLGRPTDAHHFRTAARGYTPAAIRSFCDTIGIGRKESWIDMGVLENAVREDLGESAPRVLGVLKPLKVVITNYPEDQVEEFEAQNHPKNPGMGTRTIPFCREFYIEADDFMEEPPKKFFRLAPGREVRLRYAYLITCREVVKNEAGEVVELRCTYDPASRGGSAPDGRKVKGTIHWVSARHAVAAEVRLYDRLFTVEYPDMDKEHDFKEFLNPNSLEVLRGCMLEPSLAGAGKENRFQFERQGYFCTDAKDSTANRLVFNRIVTLRDTWARIAEE